MTKLIHLTLWKVKISGEVPWKLWLPLVLIYKKVFWGLCFWYSCCVALGPAILGDKNLIRCTFYQYDFGQRFSLALILLLFSLLLLLLFLWQLLIFYGYYDYYLFYYYWYYYIITITIFTTIIVNIVNFIIVIIVLSYYYYCYYCCFCHYLITFVVVIIAVFWSRVLFSLFIEKFILEFVKLLVITL